MPTVAAGRSDEMAIGCAGLTVEALEPPASSDAQPVPMTEMARTKRRKNPILWLTAETF